MLIEIHLLQNHSPSNPNRDDLGAPKTAWFGGKLRGRISSQCWKRSMRQWPEFRSALQGHLGTRTKIFPHLVGERLRAKDCSITDEAERKNIINACKNIARAEAKEKAPERGKKADTRAKTPQLVFLQPGHVEEFVARLERLRNEMRESYDFFCDPIAAFEQAVHAQLEALGTEEAEAKTLADRSWLVAKLRQSELFLEGEEKPETWDSKDPDPTQLADRFYELAQNDAPRLKELTKRARAVEKRELQSAAPERPKDYGKFLEILHAPFQLNAVDIALFGRMTTSDAFEDVEAAVEVNHPISTNALQQEVDYFTAVDDLALPGTGAGHVAENQFNSCLYYKYLSIDWNALVKGLAGENATPERVHEMKELATRAVKALIEAAYLAVPTGKKKGHANNDPPSAILVEVKERRIPTNYANAFVRPAAPTDEHDLIEDSIRKLGQYVGCTGRSMQIPVKKRIWHAARGEPLQYIEPSGDQGEGAKTKPPQPVPETITVADLSSLVRETLGAIDLDIKKI